VVACQLLRRTSGSRGGAIGRTRDRVPALRVVCLDQESEEGTCAGIDHVGCYRGCALMGGQEPTRAAARVRECAAGSADAAIWLSGA